MDAEIYKSWHNIQKTKHEICMASILQITYIILGEKMV